MEIFGNHLLASNPISCLLSSCSTSGCSQESFGACSAPSSSGSPSIFAAAEDSSSQEESGIKISVCTEIQGAALLQKCAKEGTGQRAGLRAHLQGQHPHGCRDTRAEEHKEISALALQSSGSAWPRESRSQGEQ